MIIMYLFVFLLIVSGVVLLLGLTPERITDDIMKVISPKQTLRDKVKVALGKKRSRRIAAELYHIKDALIATGKGGQFTVVCALSLTLLICGGVSAVLINNIFLFPIFTTALALIPFAYAKNTISYYEEHIEQEMETALSIITTSYIRSDDIIKAVSENINYLKPPIRDIFKAFVGEATIISSDIKRTISILKKRFDNDIFRE